MVKGDGMNAAQVRAKARIAVQRREEQIAAEEIEAGEINLVPYLDIVTNLLLFMLVSVSAGFILGQINTTLPNYAPPTNQAKPVDPNKKPDEQRLQLVVSVTPQEILVWSMTGLEGTLKEPRARIEPVPVPIADDGATKLAFNYPKLNDVLYEIAGRRWRGKRRALETYEVILQSDGSVPYETIIAVMDNIRRRLPADPKAKLPPVFMPSAEGEGKQAKILEDYDPDKHYLFPDILFSLGFQ